MYTPTSAGSSASSRTKARRTVVRTDEHRKAAGGRVRVTRGDRTIDEFADVLGMSPKTLWLTEKGRRPVDADDLMVLHTECDASPNWIVLGLGQPPPAGPRPRRPAARARRKPQISTTTRRRARTRARRHGV